MAIHNSIPPVKEVFPWFFHSKPMVDFHLAWLIRGYTYMEIFPIYMGEWSFGCASKKPSGWFNPKNQIRTEHDLVACGWGFQPMKKWCRSNVVNLDHHHKVEWTILNKRGSNHPAMQGITSPWNQTLNTHSIPCSNGKPHTFDSEDVNKCCHSQSLGHCL